MNRLVRSHRRLPLWVDLKADESLLSLLARLTARNHLDTPTEMLAECWQGHLASLPYDHASLPLVTEWVHAPLEHLEGIAYGRLDGSCQLLGHPIHPEHVSTDCRKVCPACLGEDGAAPYHRAIWDLSLMAVCPKHGVQLIHHCHRCHQKLSWQTASPGRCRCGADLGKAPQAKIDGSMAGVEAIDNLFRTPAERHEGLAAEVGAGEVLRLVYLLGRYALNIGMRKKPLAFALDFPTEVPRVLEAGWTACQNWPHGFHRFLEQLRKRESGKRGRYGMAREFGILPTLLVRLADTPHGCVAKKAMDYFVASQQYLRTRAHGVRQLRANSTSPDRCITLTEAANRLRTRYENCRSVFDQHGLIVAGDGGRGAPLLVRERDVDQLSADLDGLLDQDQAWKHLGLAKRTFILLRDGGLLPPPADCLAAGLMPNRCWRRADLDCFLAQFTESARCGRERPGDMSFATVCRLLSPLGANAVTTVRAMLVGSITACALARGKRGFAALRFDGADVKGWQSVLSTIERTTFSVDQAAHLLQVKQEALYGWVRQGLLATVQVDGRRAEQGRRITAEAIEEFQQQYVTAGEIRRDGRLGQSKKLALMLIDQGLVPVSGPSIDGCRQFLFRRLDVEEFINRNHPNPNT